MAELSPAQIIDIALDHCSEAGIDVPPQLRRDFLVEFADIHSIKTVRDLSDKICTRLRALFKDDEIQEKYGALHMLIVEEVKWRTELVLADGREFLKSSFDRLASGEPWVLSEFIATPEGKLFYRRFGQTYGRRFDAALIKKILGINPETDALLANHPFQERGERPKSLQERGAMPLERVLFLMNAFFDECFLCFSSAE